MIYNDWHKNRINGLNKRLAAYTLVVQDILEDLNKEACRIAGRTSYGVDSDKPFTFDDYPQTKAAVERLKQQYVSDLRTFITSNTAKEWRNSNVVQDLLINKVYSECNAKIDGIKRKHLYQTNPEALKAFQTRRINQQGTLSTTLWNQSNEYLDELEKTIGTAIKKGTSAITLSKQVSKYLADFSKLKADYKQMYGKADDIHDCEWRAARLARSEINMAYRTAEQTRWQQMDFVLGYEIQLSKSHGEEDADICDDLAGRYPKDFVWTGWHPNDKCYSVPILMDEDDFVRWNNGEPVNAKPIDDVPQAFKDWVKGNAADIQKKTKEGGSLPYFVKDNKAVIRDLMPKTKTEPRAPKVAKAPAVEQKTKQPSFDDIKQKVQRIETPTEQPTFVAIEPVSPIVVKYLNERKDLKGKLKLFNEIVNDERAEVLNTFENAKTVMFEGHKGRQHDTWAGIKKTAEEINKAGESVAFLPETGKGTRADALVLFYGKPVVADFKYCTTKKGNTLTGDLKDGFQQAKTVVLKLENMDAGEFKSAVGYLLRNNLPCGNIKLVNKYGEILELSVKDIRGGKYKQKIKGFL